MHWAWWLFVSLFGLLVAWMVCVDLSQFVVHPESTAIRSSYPPIDYVVTWVNRSDPDWSRRYATQSGSDMNHDGPLPGVRESEVELYYCLQLVQKHLPWVRNIVLFTQRPQKPSWSSEIEKLRIVHHDEVFSGDTYNGLVTTSYVCRIPGLSEHYIHSDDDVYIVKPLEPGYFFDEHMRPLMRPSLVAMVPRKQSYGRIRYNTHRMLQKNLKLPRMLWYHVNHRPTPWRRAHVEMARNSIAPAQWASLGSVRTSSDFDFHGLYQAAYIAQKFPSEIRVHSTKTFTEKIPRPIIWYEVSTTS